MADQTLEHQLQTYFRKLDENQQRQVLDFARSLVKPRGVPVRDLMRFVGAIPADELDEMARIIEEDCERIEIDDLTLQTWS